MRIPVLTFLAPYLLMTAFCEEILDAPGAAAKVGENVIFEDTIHQVVDRDTGTVFLNFGAAYPKEVLTVLVMKETRSRFPGVETWEGKKVHVEGMVTEHEGHPRVILRDRGQIYLVEEN